MKTRKGGYREGSGRKSTWQSGRHFEQTKLIRVPTEYSAVLLKIAHRLDAGDICPDEIEWIMAAKDVFKPN